MPLEIMRSLYRGVDDGFDIPRLEEKSIRRSGGDPLYGELTFAGTRTLLRHLDLGRHDVFYDLGSGTGKVILQVALSAPVKRAIGYELSVSRAKVARSRLRALRKQHSVLAKRTAFYVGDILLSPIEDATVIYTCATAFSDRFMRKLMARLTLQPGPITLVSLRVLDAHRNFQLRKELKVRTTWDRKCPAYIYDVLPR